MEIALPFFAAIHYWWPKMFGKMYNERVANIAWLITFVGFNVLYFPLFIIGIQGMPRRYFDYLPEFHTGHFISTLGAFILLFGLFLMIINIYRAKKHGTPAGDNPWGGVTLEWKVPSPPPILNFDEIPTITKSPYTFEK